MKVLPGIHQWLTRIIILGVIWITNGAACTTFAPVNPINTTQPPTIDIEEPNNVLPPLRITTSTEGVYGFSLTDLEDLGISPTDIDKRQLLLTFRGESIPLWLIENPEGTYWRFYSNYIDNWYTPDNFFRLDFRGGEVIDATHLTYPTTSNGRISNIYTNTLQVEENKRFLPQVETGDPWLWQAIPGQEVEEFDLIIDHLALSDEFIPELCLNIWAGTEAQMSPDHHMIAAINQHVLIDTSWDGRGWQHFCSPLPVTKLREGKNILSIEVPGDTGAPAEVINLDWIKLTYPRQLVADGQRLTFVYSGSTQLLRGFTEEPFLYDITDNRHPMPLGYIPLDKNAQVLFQGVPHHTYLAVTSSGIIKPEISFAAVEPDLRSIQEGGDYLIIASGQYLNLVNRLVELRQSQGLSPLGIPVEAIYDQFGYGFPEPQSILDFLKYANTTWVTSPRFVLLIGDTSYDPKGYQSTPIQASIPTFYIQTDYGGITASDVIYTMFDDDNQPDVALGRLPIQTEVELNNVVDKIISYENSLSGRSKKVTAIADGQEPIFAEDAQNFIALFPQEYTADLINPLPGTNNASKGIMQSLNKGVWLVSYFGHGSLTMWGKDRLLISDDVVHLRNSNYLPVMINMTCLTGYFIHPTVRSLSEVFLITPRNGAVAVIAPTSLTLPVDQYPFSKALADIMIAYPKLTLGEVYLFAQKQLSSGESGKSEVLLTYLLFGDPALRFNY